MRILAFAKLGGNTAISAVRTLWAMRELNKRSGVDAKVASDEYVREVITGQSDRDLLGFDLYILSRIHGRAEDNPFQGLAQDGARLVYDTDDDLTDQHRDLGCSGWVEQTIGFCDAVTTSTKHLAQVYERYGKPTFVIPNLLDTGFYEKVSLSAKRHINDGRVVVGLVGTGTHWGDWMIPLDAIKKIKENYPDKVFFVCGGYVPKYYQGMVDAFIATVQFAHYPAMLRQIDIRLCPLEDTKFNESKSPIAAMEAMAAARPIGKTLGGAVPIASDFSVFRGTVNNRHNGLLVGDGGWYDAIERLLDEPFRNKLAITGLKWVQRERDIKTGVKQRLHVYEQILGGNDG